MHVYTASEIRPLPVREREICITHQHCAVLAHVIREGDVHDKPIRVHRILYRRPGSLYHTGQQLVVTKENEKAPTRKATGGEWVGTGPKKRGLPYVQVPRGQCKR